MRPECGNVDARETELLLEEEFLSEQQLGEWAKALLELELVEAFDLRRRPAGEETADFGLLLLCCLCDSPCPCPCELEVVREYM